MDLSANGAARWGAIEEKIESTLYNSIDKNLTRKKYQCSQKSLLLGSLKFMHIRYCRTRQMSVIARQHCRLPIFAQKHFDTASFVKGGLPTPAARARCERH
jgi:hypothetical protein